MLRDEVPAGKINRGERLKTMEGTGGEGQELYQITERVGINIRSFYPNEKSPYHRFCDRAFLHFVLLFLLGYFKFFITNYLAFFIFKYQVIAT